MMTKVDIFSQRKTSGLSPLFLSFSLTLRLSFPSTYLSPDIRSSYLPFMVIYRTQGRAWYPDFSMIFK